MDQIRDQMFREWSTGFFYRNGVARFQQWSKNNFKGFLTLKFYQLALHRKAIQHPPLSPPYSLLLDIFVPKFSVRIHFLTFLMINFALQNFAFMILQVCITQNGRSTPLPSSSAILLFAARYTLYIFYNKEFQVLRLIGPISAFLVTFNFC